MTFLILAAFPPELKPFQDLSRTYADLRVGEIGVGMAAAAANASRLIAEHRAERVLFVGSIGSTDPQIPMLQLVCANAVELADHNLIEKASFLPNIYSAQYEADEKMMHQLSETSSVPVLMAKCYSPLSITSSADVGRRYGRATQAHFESLEMFGIAAACNANRIPWNSLSAVTNYVGENGHEQWKETHEEAAAHTARVLGACLLEMDSRNKNDEKLQANDQRQSRVLA